MKDNKKSVKRITKSKKEVEEEMKQEYENWKKNQNWGEKCKK